MDKRFAPVQTATSITSFLVNIVHNVLNFGRGGTITHLFNHQQPHLLNMANLWPSIMQQQSVNEINGEPNDY